MTVPDPVPPAPSVALPPKPPSALKKVLNGLRAAVTSPTAVKQERSLAAFVLGRVLLSAGASAGLAEGIAKLIHG